MSYRVAEFLDAGHEQKDDHTDNIDISTAPIIRTVTVAYMTAWESVATKQSHSTVLPR